jgi:hypothetical protein
MARFEQSSSWRAANLKRLLDKHFYPFLFAAYPVLALFGSNVEEIRFDTAFRALIVSVFISVFLYYVLVMLVQDRDKAALITSMAIILFFTYGHFYNLLKSSQELGALLGKHRVLLLIWVVLFAAGLFIILKKKVATESLNGLLNIIAVTALIIPLIQIGRFEFSSYISKSGIEEQYEDTVPAQEHSNGQLPDIYLIILDAYARDDILLGEFEFDNSQFLMDLENSGFFIGTCSRSNYAQTSLSLSSSLNMNYLEALGDNYKPGNTSRAGIKELIQDNRVRNILESMGYQIVAFETGFNITQWEDADIYLSPRKGGLIADRLFSGINEFELLVLRNSLARIVIDGAALLPEILQPDLNNPNRIHYERILYVLEQLENLPEVDGPKFVFTHMVIPHGPFVFEPDGDFVDYDKPYYQGYKDQVSFINRKILPVLQEIIRQSDPEPIIILQADHGAVKSQPDTRVNILNAYYLPGEGNDRIYNSISPVNNFRTIFNLYFDGDYEILEDNSLFSTYNQPYDFQIIPESRTICTKGN